MLAIVEQHLPMFSSLSTMPPKAPRGDEEYEYEYLGLYQTCTHVRVSTFHEATSDSTCCVTLSSVSTTNDYYTCR